MKYVALVTDNVVENLIVADDDDTVDDFPEAFGCSVAIDVTDITPRPGPSWILTEDQWRPPQPFPSWVWSDGLWQPPTPIPNDEGHYLWDEDSMSWVEVDAS